MDRLCFFAMLGFLTCSAANGSVVYVNAGAPGPIRNGTSWLSAYTVVQDGVNSAYTGDQVWVATGTYAENITLKGGVALYGGFAGVETALGQRNASARITILDGGRTKPVITIGGDTTSTAVIDGFTIRNGANGISWGTQSSPIPISVSWNIITSNVGRGVDYYLGSATIAHNVITDNSGAGISSIQNVATISDNLLSGNSASDYGGGIRCQYGSATIVNNTIVNNYAARDGGGVYFVGMTAFTLTNNIIAHNSSGVWTDIAGGLMPIRNNNIYGNTAYNFAKVADPTGALGNISKDPLFVDSAAGNYRLSAGSPCVDGGYDSAVLTGDVDLDKNPRIAGGHADIGAYEYAGSGTTHCRADVNADGVVDLSNAVKVLRIIAGLDPC